MSTQEPSEAEGSPNKDDAVNAESFVKRIEGELHRVHSVRDESGDVIYNVVNPLMVEFTLRDVIQMVIGACVLAIPVAFTEEVWVLGQQLPTLNVIGIIFVSMFFLSLFAYFIFYQNHLRGHEWDFVKRVLTAYGITFVIAAILLGMLGKTPWLTDISTAFNRVVLVTFPACFSATVVDSLK